MSRPGDYCRANVDPTPGEDITVERALPEGRDTFILGCTGEGRPSCQAAECLYGAEPCPNLDCSGFKSEGAPCARCGTRTEGDR